jgi:hypothetical protein
VSGTPPGSSDQVPYPPPPTSRVEGSPPVPEPGPRSFDQLGPEEKRQIRSALDELRGSWAQDDAAEGSGPTDPNPTVSAGPPSDFPAPPRATTPADRPVLIPPSPPGIRLVGKTRNPWGVGLLCIVSLSFYFYWWYYTVNREIRDFDEQSSVQPVVALLSWVGGLFLPVFGWIFALVSWVRTGGRIRQAQLSAGSMSRCSGWLGLVLGVVTFGPVYYQSQLNKVWDMYDNPPSGTEVGSNPTYLPTMGASSEHQSVQTRPSPAQSGPSPQSATGLTEEVVTESRTPSMER